MNGIGYEFPVQLIRNLDQMNPDSFNHDLIVAAEKLSGNINEHAVNAGEAAALTIGTGAFGTPHIVVVESDPDYGTPGSYSEATFDTSNDGWPIPNHGNWEQVDGMTLTFTTSGCMIWMVSCLQAIWERVEVENTDAANYQIALRLDGAVLDWTIPGHLNQMHQPSFAFKYTPQKDGTVAIPGPAIPKVGIVSAIGEPSSPDRCIASSMFALTAGSHTIEVVARRGFRSIQSASFTTTDNVWIFDRMLFALEVPTVTYGTSTAYEHEITPIEPNDTVATTTLYDPLVSMRAQYNDIENSNTARGIFNTNHGYSAVLFTAQEYIEPNSAQGTTSGYPGYSSVSTDATGVGNGWYLLNDGAGKNLRTDETTPAGFVVDGKKCAILVLANVQYRDIDHIDEDDNTAFTILYRSGGAVHKIPGCTFFYNKPWRGSGAVLGFVPNEAWISIAGILDFTDTAPTDDIDWFGVYASVLNTSNDPLSEFTYQRASMQVIAFRP